MDLMELRGFLTSWATLAESLPRLNSFSLSSIVLSSRNFSSMSLALPRTEAIWLTIRRSCSELSEGKESPWIGLPRHNNPMRSLSSKMGKT